MRSKQQNDFCHSFFLSFLSRDRWCKYVKTRCVASYGTTFVCSFPSIVGYKYICDVVKSHFAGSYEIEAAKRLLSFLSFFPSYRQIDRLNMSQVDKSRFVASFPIKQQNDFCSFFLSVVGYIYVYVMLSKVILLVHIKRSSKTTFVISFFPSYREIDGCKYVKSRCAAS